MQQVLTLIRLTFFKTILYKKPSFLVETRVLRMESTKILIDYNLMSHACSCIEYIQNVDAVCHIIQINIEV